METITRMAERKTTVLHVRRALPVLLCAMLSLPSWASRRVPVFLVGVTGQSAPALQQAMRAALVRATGHPEAATDPIFASLVAQAQQYVVNYQRGAHGKLQVAFNGAAVDQVITGLGRSVWSPDRPFTLVVVTPMPDQADYQADHDAIGQAAEARGLPISIMPLPVTGPSGRLLPRAALLRLVHRFGAEQLLIGQPPAVPAGTVPGAVSADAPGAAGPAQTAAASAPAAPAPATPAAAGANAPSGTAAPAAAPQWKWTLVTPFMRRSFTGSVTAGIDRTVDLLAPPPTLAANRSSKTRVRIEDVSTLADYAHIEVMLAAVPGVSHAEVSEVHGNTAVFAMQARGGSAAVARLLSGSRRFARVQAPDGALVYRYLPARATTPPSAQPSQNQPSRAATR